MMVSDILKWGFLSKKIIKEGQIFFSFFWLFAPQKFQKFQKIKKKIFSQKSTLTLILIYWGPKGHAREDPA